MNWGDIEKLDCLEVTESDDMEFKGLVYKFIRATKKVHNIQYPEISKYIFVELDEERIKNLELKNDINIFKEFQDKLLSTTFFNCKDDLRWNLYLFMIVDDYKLLNNVQLYDVINDDNYARKYFLTFEDMIDLVKKDNFLKNGSKSYEFKSPLHEWLEVLKKIKLTGVLDKFAKQPVIDYIYDGKTYEFKDFNSDSGNKTPSYNLDEIRPIHISKVELGEFRNHCFRDTRPIGMGLVNLLHGPNGSGKTSILEAIEYAITNKIKRIKDFGGDNNTLPEVQIVCKGENGDLELKSSKNTAFCKQLDRAWYGTPIGGGPCNTFNPNFNHFNNFNSETAYKFALEESNKESNYNEKFSRLLYDDSLIAMENNWRRYREEFQDQSKKIKKLIDANEDEILRVKNTIKSTKNIKLDREVIEEKLLEIKYKLNSSIEDDLFKKYLSVLETFNTLSGTVNQFKANITNCGKYDIHTYNDELSILNNKLLSLGEDLKNATKQVRILDESIRDEKQKIDILNKQISKEKDIQILVDETLNQWFKVKFIIEDKNKLDEFKELSKRKKKLKDDLSNINRILLKYSKVFELKYDDINIDASINIDDIKLEIAKLYSRFDDIERNIHTLSGNVTGIKELKTQLNSLGLTILNLSEEKSVCPLCGTNHVFEATLINKINSYMDSMSDFEKKLKELQDNKTKINQAISSQKGILETDRLKRDNQDLVFAFIKELEEYHYKIVNSNEKENLLDGCRKALSFKEELIFDLGRVEGLLEILNSEGYCDLTIEQANYFVSNNDLYKKFQNDIKYHVIEFEQFLYDIKQEVNNSVKEQLGDIEELDRLINGYEAKKNSLYNLQEIISGIQQKKQEIRKINEIITQFKNIALYFMVQEDDDLFNWTNTFEEVRMSLEIEVNKVKAVNNISEKEVELKGLTSRGRSLFVSQERCNEAVTALNSLKTLEYYSQEFIQKNIKRIEHFFKMLHMPKEFEDLNIVDGAMVALRSKDREEVRIYEMSTGQRVSLALSVMFSSYLAATKAPRFIMLDEPVANMDDLHLLNLLDILREFALNGTQILFTTANPEVAGLFRRKFSFFGSDFRHYELNRNSDNYTEIKIYKYSPKINEGELLKDIS